MAAFLCRALESGDCKVKERVSMSEGKFFNVSGNLKTADRTETRSRGNISSPVTNTPSLDHVTIHFLPVCTNPTHRPLSRLSYLTFTPPNAWPCRYRHGVRSSSRGTNSQHSTAAVAGEWYSGAREQHRYLLSRYELTATELYVLSGVDSGSVTWLWLQQTYCAAAVCIFKERHVMYCRLYLRGGGGGAGNKF